MDVGDRVLVIDEDSEHRGAEGHVCDFADSNICIEYRKPDSYKPGLFGKRLIRGESVRTFICRDSVTRVTLYDDYQDRKDKEHEEFISSARRKVNQDRLDLERMISEENKDIVSMLSTIQDKDKLGFKLTFRFDSSYTSLASFRGSITKEFTERDEKWTKDVESNSLSDFLLCCMVAAKGRLEAEKREKEAAEATYNASNSLAEFSTNKLKDVEESIRKPSKKSIQGGQ